MCSLLYALLFPFLFGGTFIEATSSVSLTSGGIHFPSFLEGLSLRDGVYSVFTGLVSGFPFLFGGAFIEGLVLIFRVLWKP